MRIAVLALACTGCLSAITGSGDGTRRPAVMNNLTELPADPGRRDQVLDSSTQTPGPEQRKGQSVRARKIETAAATTAAVIGSLFSKTQNVMFGEAFIFDENQVVHPTRPQAEREEGPPQAPIDVPAQTLVPWIKLAPGEPAELPEQVR